MLKVNEINDTYYIYKFKRTFSYFNNFINKTYTLKIVLVELGTNKNNITFKNNFFAQFSSIRLLQST